MLLMTTVLSKSAGDWVQVGVGGPCFPHIYSPAWPGRLHSSLLRSSLLSLLLSGRGWGWRPLPSGIEGPGLGKRGSSRNSTLLSGLHAKCQVWSRSTHGQV